MIVAYIRCFQTEVVQNLLNFSRIADHSLRSVLCRFLTQVITVQKIDNVGKCRRRNIMKQSGKRLCRVFCKMPYNRRYAKTMVKARIGHTAIKTRKTCIFTAAVHSHLPQALHRRCLQCRIQKSGHIILISLPQIHVICSFCFLSRTGCISLQPVTDCR